MSKVLFHKNKKIDIAQLVPAVEAADEDIDQDQ